MLVSVDVAEEVTELVDEDVKVLVSVDDKVVDGVVTMQSRNPPIAKLSTITFKCVTNCWHCAGCTKNVSPKQPKVKVDPENSLTA